MKKTNSKDIDDKTKSGSITKPKATKTTNTTDTIPDLSTQNEIKVEE